MRNPNGYGSVYKLSGKRRRPFVARITNGWDDKGHPIYSILGYFKERPEAMIALAEYNKNPYDIEASQITLAEMYETFKQRRFDKISGSGQRIYSAAYKHLSPLHGEKMKELKTYQLQSLVDGINRKWQTKSHVVVLLNQLFDIAIELDICEKNYSKFINIGEKPESNLHKAFTPDEIKLLTENVFTKEYADTALIMIYSGLRPTELLELKIENIDIEKRTMVGGIKTKAGKDRIIPISKKTLQFVLKRYNKNNKYLIEQDGKKMSYQQYKKHWTTLVSELNLDHLPHDCRHTFATLMDTAGANKLAIKKIMGHSSQDITDKIYTHKEAAELIKNVDLI